MIDGATASRSALERQPRSPARRPRGGDATRAVRILALTNLYPNPQQPHRAAYNRQHFREFAAAGHAVRVIAPVPWTDELAAWRGGKPPLPRDRRTTLDGIPVEHPRYWFTPKFM